MVVTVNIAVLSRVAKCRDDPGTTNIGYGPTRQSPIASRVRTSRQFGKHICAIAALPETPATAGMLKYIAAQRKRAQPQAIARLGQ
jgi:hypothetical protein